MAVLAQNAGGEMWAAVDGSMQCRSSPNSFALGWSVGEVILLAFAVGMVLGSILGVYVMCWARPAKKTEEAGGRFVTMQDRSVQSPVTYTSLRGHASAPVPTPCFLPLAEAAWGAWP